MPNETYLTAEGRNEMRPLYVIRVRRVQLVGDTSAHSV